MYDDSYWSSGRVLIANLLLNCFHFGNCCHIKSSCHLLRRVTIIFCGERGVRGLHGALSGREREARNYLNFCHLPFGCKFFKSSILYFREICNGQEVAKIIGLCTRARTARDQNVEKAQRRILRNVAQALILQGVREGLA